MPFLSSFSSDFNTDFAVRFTQEQVMRKEIWLIDDYFISTSKGG